MLKKEHIVVYMLFYYIIKLKKDEVIMVKDYILIVDDEQHICELLQFNLEKEGFLVKTAQSGKAALMQINNKKPILIVLDLMMPEIDGLTVVKLLKREDRTSEIPIIMLTAKSEEFDKVLGLELGADDYMTKPFSIRELVARIKALLRRTSYATEKNTGPEETDFTFNNLHIDFENYTTFINEEKIALTLKEFELLRCLIINKNKVLTRDYLLDKIWGYEYFGETRTVDVHIRHLRIKLHEYGDMIETVRGVGYRLNLKKV